MGLCLLIIKTFVVNTAKITKTILESPSPPESTSWPRPNSTKSPFKVNPFNPIFIAKFMISWRQFGAIQKIVEILTKKKDFIKLNLFFRFLRLWWTSTTAPRKENWFGHCFPRRRLRLFWCLKNRRRMEIGPRKFWT